MPGYGVSDAATTLVGQSMGAGRHELMKRFAWLSVALGMGIMTLMGIVMYVGAPFAMSMMTPSEEVRQLGVEVLRIEAFAEPMFGAIRTIDWQKVEKPLYVNFNSIRCD